MIGVNFPSGNESVWQTFPLGKEFRDVVSLISSHLHKYAFFMPWGVS